MFAFFFNLTLSLQNNMGDSFSFNQQLQLYRKLNISNRRVVTIKVFNWLNGGRGFYREIT